MLTKRTNLLLEKTDYQLLYTLAKRQEVSVAELIRKAIEKTYKQETQNELNQRKRKVMAIQKLWQTTQIKKLDYKRSLKSLRDYKALVENGRKY